MDDINRMNQVEQIYNQHPSPSCLQLTKQDVISGQLFWEDCLKAMAPDMAGKDVLCLASGGGQQSLHFGLLGANVTVVDISETQLEQDRVAAREKGYKITCYNHSMEDLSIFPNGAFDLVYQAISICFMKDPSMVYRNVARVLKDDGIYRVEHVNPQAHDVRIESWNGDGYLVDEEIFSLPDGDDVEFTFTMSQIFNGLIENGLEIIEVRDDPDSLRNANECTPGTEDHFDRFLLNAFSVVSRKKG